MKACLLLALMAACSATSTALADYDTDTLRVKQMFSQRALQALNEPFVGVTSNGVLQPGLFPVRATGVSTASIVKAADKFLTTLKPEQTVRTLFSVQDSEWRHWSNVDNGIFVRQGVSLKEMADHQRQAAMNLIKTSLSAKGVQLSLDIMKTDQTLSEINEDVLSFDEEMYFFTIMGRPSSDEPWGWQIDGHHLVINYFVLGDQVVMTPLFLGGEPTIARTGKYQGNKVLQEEQNLGLSLMLSLSEKQQVSATLNPVKVRNNNLAEANQDNRQIPYQGTSVSGFSEAQKNHVLELIELFVGNMRKDLAAVKMDEVIDQLNNTWFAWHGKIGDDEVFYFRIHSPVVLIEFDHQLPVGTSLLNKKREPTRDHIHVVVRTPNGNDYGKDLLRQHLLEHAH